MEPGFSRIFIDLRGSEIYSLFRSVKIRVFGLKSAFHTEFDLCLKHI